MYKERYLILQHPTRGIVQSFWNLELFKDVMGSIRPNEFPVMGSIQPWTNCLAGVSTGDLSTGWVFALDDLWDYIKPQDSDSAIQWAVQQDCQRG